MEPRISIITLGVQDMKRAFNFYHEGLGLPTSNTPESGIIFFKTSGVCLALFPLDKLAEDANADGIENTDHFSGITLAHNTRTKTEVDEILSQALASGGRIIKPAADTFWGGYSGYFEDPDGYKWEIAYADSWEFNDDGSLKIG